MQYSTKMFSSVGLVDPVLVTFPKRIAPAFTVLLLFRFHLLSVFRGIGVAILLAVLIPVLLHH